jgi:hypothetical protein
MSVCTEADTAIVPVPADGTISEADNVVLMWTPDAGATSQVLTLDVVARALLSDSANTFATSGAASNEVQWGRS